MSVDTITRVFQCSKAEMAARLVLLVLADRADQCDTCYPAQDDIATRANIHRDSVRKIIERLIEMGEVLPRYRAGRSTCYMVTVGKDAKRIEKDVRQAWGVSLADLASQNGAIVATISRASGGNLKPKTKAHPLSANQSVDPLSGDQSVSKDNPLIRSRGPIDPQPVNPLSGDQSEPSYNRQEPSVRGADAPRAESAKPKTDPVTHAMDRRAKVEAEGRHVSLLRSAARPGQDAAVEMCMAFADLTQIKPVDRRDATGQIAAAAEMVAGGCTIDDMRAAWRQSQDKLNGFQVTDLHSLKRTARAIAAERARTQTAPRTGKRYEFQRQPDGSMLRVEVTNA